jgi:hypothetical protein
MVIKNFFILYYKFLKIITESLFWGHNSGLKFNKFQHFADIKYKISNSKRFDSEYRFI